MPYESRDVLWDVQTVEPLSDGHHLLVFCITDNILSLLHTFNCTMSVFNQMLLDLGHGDFVVGQLHCEFVRVFLFAFKELEE